MRPIAGDAGWAAGIGTVATGFLFAGLFALWREDAGWSLILMMFVGPLTFGLAMGTMAICANALARRPHLAWPVYLTAGALGPFAVILAVEAGGGDWRYGLSHWLRNAVMLLSPVAGGGLVSGAVMAWRRRAA